jgi:Bacterial capsule synthesis protein PGA_cap
MFPKSPEKQANKPFNFAVIFIIIGGLFLVGTLGFAFYSANLTTNSPKITARVAGIRESEFSSSIAISKSPKPDKLNLKTMFFGNTFWGRYIDDWAKASPLKEKYPFSGLDTLERYKYDAWISGMECPITSTYRSSKLQDSDLKFSCLPQYLPEAAKWLDVLSLANNHTDNMEEVNGFDQTKKYLTENKIEYFGHFDNSNLDEICKVINLEIKDKSVENNFRNNPNIGVENPDNNSQSLPKINSNPYFVPIAFCGYHNVFKLPTQTELAQISEYSKYWPTVVMPHGGAEYTSKPDQIKTDLYRQMIDLGADTVIGDHPHNVQSTEAWRDKLIVYSLGNFMFDQQTRQDVRQSLAVGAEFELEFDTNLEKLMEISQKCTNFENNLTSTKKENLSSQKSENSQPNSQPNSQKDEQNNSNSQVQNSQQKNGQKNEKTNSQSCLEMAKREKIAKPKFKIKYEATATDSTDKLTKKASPEILKDVLNLANWAKTKTVLDQINDKTRPNLPLKDAQST